MNTHRCPPPRQYQSIGDPMIDPPDSMSVLGHMLYQFQCLSQAGS